MNPQTIYDILETYGVWVLLTVILLTHWRDVVGFFQSIIRPVAPALAKRIEIPEKRFSLEAEERMKRLEVELEGRMLKLQTDAQNRVDVILMLKDLIIQYRGEVQDAKLSRRQAETEVREVIRGYERLSTQVIEVLRDVSEVIRAQTARLSHLEETYEYQCRKAQNNTNVPE